MRLSRNIFFTTLLLLDFGFSQTTHSDDEIGDARLGLEYARKNCSSCHGVLQQDAYSQNLEATPFNILAQTPGITRTALGVFLQTSHANMPNLIVKGEDADNLITYILSLKERTSQ